MDPKLIEALKSATPQEIAKAAKELHGLHGIEIIKDLWVDEKSFHHVPGAEKNEGHPSGPAMESSGAGAEKGMKNYSNPAPQIGLVAEYDKKDKSIEDFESMGKAMKANFEGLSDVFKSGISSLLDAIKASKTSDKTEKPTIKSEALVKGWESMSDLILACSEIEGEQHDVANLQAARGLIEEAETHLDTAETHERAELRDMEVNAAHKAMVKAWDALHKARKVERHGLKGDGNQEDKAVPSTHSENVAKARYYASKAGYTIIKSEEEEKKEEKKEEKHEMKKDPDPDPDPKEMKKDPDPDPDPKCKSEVISALRASIKALEESMKKDPDPDPDPKEMKKDPDPDPDPKSMKKDPDPDPDPKMEKSEVGVQLKNALARISQLEAQAKSHAPTMTPIILSESGELVKNPEAMSKAMFTKLDEALESGALNEEDVGQARGLIDRFKAAAKGHIPRSIPDQQLRQASMSVRNFFDNMLEVGN